MKLGILTLLLMADALAGWPYERKRSDLISWSAVSGEIESILDDDFAEYVDQPATSVSKSVSVSFYVKVLDNFFATHPDCQDTFLIDYTLSNFYNHLITYTDGNIALTIERTVENFDMSIPEDFDDDIEILDTILQKPIHDLLHVIDDLELEPAWEMTKQLRGFIHSSPNAGLTYKEAMMATTEIIVKWFEENVDKCSADENSYMAIATAMEADTAQMTSDATQEVIDTVMNSAFVKMGQDDIQMINAALYKAKFMRNMIWTKLKSAMSAGRTATQGAAPNSIGAVLHVTLEAYKKKRQNKKSKEDEYRELYRKLIRALENFK